MFRIDFIFSYWIFAWYLLYMARITIYSPKLALIIAVIEAIVSYLLLKTANTFTMVSTLIIVSCIKIIPLITLWREPIRQKDIWVLFTLFMIYNIWLGIYGETMLGVYKKIQVLLDKNTNELPFMYVLSKLLRRT
jgi:hypothetical protein